MKRILTFISIFLTSIVLIAQEAESQEYERNEFSTTTKWVIVAVFALLIIILVLRTFRNKPTL